MHPKPLLKKELLKDELSVVAFSPTKVPDGYENEQALGAEVVRGLYAQSMLPSVVVTVPRPLPIGAIVSVWVGIGSKSALTDCACVIETLHTVLVPLHAPDQPLKTELASGDSVSCTGALTSG